MGKLADERESRGYMWLANQWEASASLTSEGGRSNEEQGRTAPVLASSCRSTAWFFYIFFYGRILKRTLKIDGRFLFYYKNSLNKQIISHVSFFYFYFFLQLILYN
jgi:hypothetical protein